MGIAQGSRVGPYEIVAALGAGGMGEVYRATDTNLGREVAIKVLPDAFARDADRLARFEREARTLASLSHPNIAIVHGFERAGGVNALVMELVEGPTLADRLARGPLPPDEALPIARQIAQALESAHEQGIVHRDLKPANVKVTPEGVVKVLDFGLAKAIEAGVGSRESGVEQTRANSPTITSPAMTQAGVILGTAAYMSPEQAKGRLTDKRSDVWAFGCVLYEMLAGHRAFGGDDISDTLASILKTEPDWAALPADLPPAVRALMQQCLIKDRRQRVADLSVANFVLSQVGALDPAPGRSIQSGIASSQSSRRLVVPVAAAAIVTALAVGLGAWLLGSAPPERNVGRFVLPIGETMRLGTGSRPFLALSPDGRQLAWTGRDSLFLRALSEFDARVVPGTENTLGISDPVFSPDGASIAYFSATDISVRRIVRGGGASVLVCTPGAAPYGMSWDRSAILVSLPSGVRRCNPNGGQPELLAAVEQGEQAYGPRTLPGGRALIFTVAKAQDGLERWDRARIVLQPLPSGERRTLIDGGSDARYLATGHLLYSVRGNVLAVPFDPVRQVVTGGSVPVLEGVRRSTTANTGATHWTASDSGTLAYAPGPVHPTSAFIIATADRAGTLTPLKTKPGRYIQVRASRDGRRLAVETDDGKEANVSTLELGGTTSLMRLTYGGRNRFPVWSPDGQRVAFQSDRDGDLAVFAQRIDGTGVVRLTKPERSEAHVPESWSADGRHLSFTVQRGADYTLWTLSLADGKATRFGKAQSVEPMGSTFSPDGKWIAYHALPADVAAQSSSAGVFVEPFPAADARFQAPRVLRDFQPVWSLNGTELFYVASAVSGELAAVPVSSRAGMTFGTPAALPFLVNAGRLSVSTRAFDVLPDGTFVGVVAEASADRPGMITDIRIVLNWHEELKRLVPTR